MFLVWALVLSCGIGCGVAVMSVCVDILSAHKRGLCVSCVSLCLCATLLCGVV